MLITVALAVAVVAVAWALALAMALGDPPAPTEPSEGHQLERPAPAHVPAAVPDWDGPSGWTDPESLPEDVIAWDDPEGQAAA